MVELIAALAGTYYYYKTKDVQIKLFVKYLWIIVVVETLGMYTYVLQNNYDSEVFIWIKNSVFCSNRWLYNTFTFLSVMIFGLFYRRIINDNLSKRIIKFSVSAYALFAIIYFGFSGDFFIKTIPYDIFLETLVVVILVILYYRQLLKSDDILFFHKQPVFYISSGLLLWYLCITPLFIFDGYFYAINSDFVTFRRIYLFVANLFLYLCYTFGFIYALQYKKQ
jgi:uncharacterized membrane protein YfcA